RGARQCRCAPAHPDLRVAAGAVEPGGTRPQAGRGDQAVGRADQGKRIYRRITAVPMLTPQTTTTIAVRAVLLTDRIDTARLERTDPAAPNPPPFPLGQEAGW